LHDGLGQQLTGIGYMMTALQEKLARPSPARAREAKKLQQMIMQTLEDTRNLARGFYPVELEQHGLLFALAELMNWARQTLGLSYVLESDGDPRCAELKGAVAIQLFRVAQEAVHNATKHAHAQQVVVRLARGGDRVVLTVKDDGIGFPLDLSSTKGMGLRIMRHRARMVGGTLETVTAQQGGVVVTCSVPATR
jgi:signal transduction histidine kinase